jgi:hypothetical protein
MLNDAYTMPTGCVENLDAELMDVGRTSRQDKLTLESSHGLGSSLVILTLLKVDSLNLSTRTRTSVIGRLGPIHNEFCPVDGAPEMFSLLCFYE